jgi:hypothetical protein
MPNPSTLDFMAETDLVMVEVHPSEVLRTLRMDLRRRLAFRARRAGCLAMVDVFDDLSWLSWRFARDGI